MQLLGLLESKRTEVVERWASLALGVYSQGADSFIGREKDRFRNPVGHITGESLTALFDSLLAGEPAEALADPLDGIVRVRAIQELSPAQALGFVFLLKRAIQEVLGEALAEPGIRGQQADLYARIDQMALEGFNRFVKCREAIYELRTREAKRRTYSLVKRLEDLTGKDREAPADEAETQQPKGGNGA